MNENEQELLKVLDMSEDEQKKVIQGIVCPEGRTNFYCCLESLAFRLRDEIDFNIYLEELEVIYHLWQKRGTIDEQMENNLITFTCWLAVYITPIDRIIAALMTKEKSNDSTQ